MSLKLMIVDDSSVMRSTIEYFLDDYDLEIVGQAEDGEQALDVFEEVDPDVVTMDITMPKMDGVTCLEKMLEMRPDTKVMIITALSDKATGLLALTKGARGYLSKPITPERLKEAFDKLLKRS